MLAWPNPLVTALNGVMSSIKKKYGLLVILFFSQFAFIVTFFLVQYYYQLPALENLQLVLGALGQANYDPELISQGVPLLPSGGAGFYDAYLAFVYNLKLLAVFTLATFAVLEGLVWAIAGYIVHQTSFWRRWLRSGLVMLIFLVPTVVLLYLIAMSSSFGSTDAPTAAGFIYSSAAVIILVTHGLIVALSLTHHSLKKLWSPWWRMATRKAHWLLAGYLLCAAVLAPFLYLLYYSVEQFPFFVLLISLTIVVALLALIPLYVVGLVNTLEKEI